MSERISDERLAELREWAAPLGPVSYVTVDSMELEDLLDELAEHREREANPIIIHMDRPSPQVVPVQVPGPCPRCGGVR